MLLLILFQGGYCFLDYYVGSKGPQLELNADLQAHIDSLKSVQVAEKRTSFSIDPTYISDYRGYLLGMSPTEIDRLHRFREDGKRIQSPAQFRQVTGISDSLFQAILPQLRFSGAKRSTYRKKSELKPRIVKKGLKSATAKELESIYGIGKVLSKRIVKFRNALGGFIDEDQLYDVYGLEESVVRRVLDKYEIRTIPEVKRVSINSATVTELASSVYLSWDVAREIVAHRDSVGGFSEWEEIAGVQGFPIDKIERIKLYLTL